jgi:small GTP-binding protein
MTDLTQQIEKIEEEIRKTPHHKATEHHIGKLRAKLARLKDKLIQQGVKKGGGGGYAIKKQGDATIVLVGHPSVGKSTLINKLTNAKSKIAPYEFTTTTVIPGLMVYKDARIQILDVPGLIKGAEEGKGRGREVLSVIRTSDLLIILTEVGKENALEQITKTLNRNGIRINTNPPDITVNKKVSGGIILHSNIKQDISNDLIKETALEYGIKNAEITLKERVSLERLIDAFSTNRAYIKALFVVNKIDTQKISTSSLKDSISISAKKGKGINKLKEAIWDKLTFIRIYTVKPNEKPNTNHPQIMKVGQTILDVGKKLGSEFLENKKRAKIWGIGAKHPGQEVSFSTKLQDDMQIRFV